eukprot:CAMPEP_0167802978 /NCGR_PEP_ID=MMETSP0111_2-20121227/19487_1 /TAXON_ID=91324 /ORGANISM="Lotharella globosa, Strain CCCM811" /LENGTH=142 /DNA_ID=CAMNT_0007699209 /DNA_START=296 /DNA_END=724 /DNA_ORIENTATION=-
MAHFGGIIDIQKKCFPSSREHSSIHLLEGNEYAGGELHKFIFTDNYAECERTSVAAYILYQLDNRTKGAHVISLGTCPDHRKKGHAKELMHFCNTHARDKGYTHATLLVRKSNEKALGLYQNLGYMEHRVFTDYYRSPTEDA